MRTFAQKPKATHQVTPANSTIPRQTHFGRSHGVNSILHLQRTIGNQAAQRMLKTDIEEPKAELTDTALPLFSHDFGRIPVYPPTAGVLQTKLAISTPGDQYEQEADQVADQVMRMPDPTLQRACAPCAAGWAPYPKCQDGKEGLVQRKTEQVSDTAGVPDNFLHGLGAGQPLDSGTRAFMEPRFGYDFSGVRVHTDAKATESAQAVNALAYTVGQDVVFGAGQYAPDTSAGQKLMAHELTHVVQQSQGSNFLQRLIRGPYPWRGVIIPSIGARIRSTPDLSDLSNVLDAIPRGETVRVLSASGSWLRVESRYRGPVLVGYIYHTLVDDATSSSMETSVGTGMIWEPSGPGSGTTFESWASAPSETSFPTVTSTTVMNCWEAVLLSAYQAGAINWNWIHNIYVSTPVADWVTAMSRGARRSYAVPGPNHPMPQRGDLVFFNGLAHVALATGNGSEVFTFWPPPNTPFTPGGTSDRVKKFTIEALVTWWETNMPPKPTVEFAAPNW